MSRLMGLVLAVMFLMMNRSADAQAPMYGGFGMEYTQPIPANTYVLDRWWMVQATPMVGSALPPPVMAQAPAAVQQPVYPGRLSRRAARTARSYSRTTMRPYNGAAVQPMSPLPTGSLYWPTAPGTPLYVPAQRYAAYGQGYGVSPYGSADYGAQYKGMYWGY